MAMVNIEEGGVYTASKVNSGISQRGNWELTRIFDEKTGKDSVTLFINNCPSGLTEGAKFKVKRISSFKFGPRKDSFTDRSTGESVEKWIKAASGCVDIELFSEPTFDEEIDDGELPWSIDNPFGVSPDDQLPL